MSGDCKNAISIMVFENSHIQFKICSFFNKPIICFVKVNAAFKIEIIRNKNIYQVLLFTDKYVSKSGGISNKYNESTFNACDELKAAIIKVMSLSKVQAMSNVLKF